MAGRQHKPYPIVIRDLEVLEAFDVTPGMRRVVLGGDQLHPFRNNGFDIGPFLTENADDHVKLVFLDPDGDVPVPVQDDGHLDWTAEALGRARDYTPRRFDAEAGRLELDFVRHEGGLAAEWAVAAEPGDRLLVAGPRGTTVLPDDIDWWFLVGDETALPAIARRIEELPAGTPVSAVVSIPSAVDEETFDHATDLDITWVHRDTERDPQAALEAAIQAAPWRDGQVYAWAAGESGMLKPVRRWFKERQIDRGHTDVSGYWRAGQSQADKGQALQRLRHDKELALPYALRAAVSLSLADRIDEGARTVESLAAASGADARGLRKLLRLLDHAGYVRLTGDAVALTAIGASLQEDIAHSHLGRDSGYARLDDAWPGLLDALRTGGSGYEHAVGESFWTTLARDETLGTTFDDELAGWAGQWSRAVAEHLDAGSAHVVDVGGGTGELLTRLLERAPGARGTLVDLPTTAERARKRFAESGVADRAEVAAQSFFEPLPGGGDLYVLAQVLHDWPDAEAELILRRAAEAAGDAPVYLVERIPSAEDHDHDIVFDLEMFTVFGGGERSLEEYSALAEKVGLRRVGSTELEEELHLIELRRA